MMFLANRLRGAGKNITATVEFLSQHVTISDLITYLFSNIGFGAPFQGRKILIGVHYDGDGVNDRLIEGVTIGGVAATLCAIGYVNSNGSRVNAIYAAEVSAGTVGDVVVTGEGVGSHCAIEVYSARGLRQLVSDVINTDNSTGTSVSLNLTAPKAGFAIAVASTRSATSAFTWSGLTEHSDAAMEQNRYSGASANFTSAGAKTISYSLSSDPTSTNGVSAFFS